MTGTEGKRARHTRIPLERYSTGSLGTAGTEAGSCRDHGEEAERLIALRGEDAQSARDMKRIDIDDPEVDIDHDHRLTYAEEPFTGEVEEHVGEQRVSLATYVDGYCNGLYREWYPDGTLRAEGIMRMGSPSGEFRRWHANGVLARRLINSADGRTPLAEYEWDEEGRPTRFWERTTSR